MFGYLPAPCRCQIGDQADLYHSTFCGLCNALARQYGQPARMLINRDSTFVAVLAAAQNREAPRATLSTRCLPWSRPIRVFEYGPIVEFAGAVTLCGLKAKLDDECADERGLRAAGCRLLSTLSRPRYERAQAILAASDFPVIDVRRYLGEQSNIEARVVKGGDPAHAAQPSARAFGAILAHTARLTGNAANVEPLHRAGQSLGELIYTLDAYQDAPEDLRRGRFNFLAAQLGSLRTDSMANVRGRAREIAAACQGEIRRAWQEVDLLRYRPVLEAVLLTGLSARTEQVLATTAGHLMTDGDESEGHDDDGGSATADASCCDGRNACFCPSGDYSGCCECCTCLDCCNSDCCNGDCCNGCDCSGCDCGGCDCSG